MRKKIKLLTTITLLVMFVLSLTSCGKKQDGQTQNSENAGKNEPIVIKYPSFQVGVNSYAPVLAKNIEEFNKKYEGKIKVEIEEIPGDQAYVDKMKVLLSANELPDIVYAGGYNLLDPALEKNAVVDLTPYLDADPEWKAMFSKEVLEFNSRNGKIYSLPNERQVIGYFYNKELFKKAGINEPPKTWDEFFAVCDKLKAAGITPLSMDTQDSGWLTSLWMNSMVGTNGDNGNKLFSVKYKYKELQK
ncbi:raffinose/stachyose/melibiose transport system substrate-binding protein [Caloramator quimbayensis]|uniref:Raffinose/stachyose/melibiose transport system substrate-binding protein n=1 Tax=Caloramator quimbayensis TaxID=1147123 RepID=A0A1T4WDZ8_9CLOT|nr:extracellular solute-binding protein [Caloramator quimbayensis]SKA75359.1 raffinose/stachyose/melibiose transport system substrate-binding protein [Caloramator quimbayensis]